MNAKRRISLVVVAAATLSAVIVGGGTPPNSGDSGWGTAGTGSDLSVVADIGLVDDLPGDDRGDSGWGNA